MTLEIATVLFLLGGAMVLFVGEWFPVDLVALGLVAALVVTGLLTPEQAFSGFASEVIVILASIFVLAGVLRRTGVMGWLEIPIQRLGGRGEAGVLATVMGLSAGFSAFLSNTNVTAGLMPGVLETARKGHLAPSRLLIPLASASMLGGSCTLLGTSANLAASGLMEELGMEGISLFELAPVGIAMTVMGVLYMVLVGRHLLPKHHTEPEETDQEVRGYLSELVIGAEAPYVGQRLRETDLATQGIQVLAVRSETGRRAATPRTRIEAEDVLLVQGSRESLLRLADRPGLGLEAAPELRIDELLAGSSTLAEAVLMPGSPLLGRTLRESRFRQTYGASVLAIVHRGATG